MSPKAISLNIIWAIVSSVLIMMFSTQDKEWFIDGYGINNICDLMIYIENDDIRDVGVIFTLPLFIPYLYAMVWKKQRSVWQFLVMMMVVLFWLWRFIIRYQLCL